MPKGDYGSTSDEDGVARNSGSGSTDECFSGSDLEPGTPERTRSNGEMSDLPAPSKRMSRRMDLEIRLSKRKANKHELAKAVAAALASRTVTQHQRQIRAISRQMNTYQGYASLVALVSILTGVAINELCCGYQRLR